MELLGSGADNTIDGNYILNNGNTGTEAGISLASGITDTIITNTNNATATTIAYDYNYEPANIAQINEQINPADYSTN